jgi:hypothetical protein
LALPAQVERALLAAGGEAHRLEIEITERLRGRSGLVVVASSSADA